MLLAKYVGPNENIGFTRYQVYELQDFYNNRGITVMDARTCLNNKSYKDLNEFKKDWVFVSEAYYTPKKRRISDDQAYFIAATVISGVSIAIVAWMIWVG
jgi:hypothetical protein